MKYVFLHPKIDPKREGGREWVNEREGWVETDRQTDRQKEMQSTGLIVYPCKLNLALYVYF